MATNNYINGNFDDVADAAASGNINGIGVGNLAITGTSNLGAIGNISIANGSPGQFMTTNGSGVLRWSSPLSGSGPILSVYRSSIQTVTPGATVVLFNATEYDTGAYYNSTNGRYTPLVAGYYRVLINLIWIPPAASAIPSNYAALLKNGTEYKRGFQWNPQTGTIGAFSVWTGQCDATLYLNGTTDYIAARSFTGNESSQTWNIFGQALSGANGGDITTRMEVFWIHA